jgi:hypothetical protein
MNTMTTAMDSIQAASQEVTKILKTIDEIAFQTNILALNAAVEAARAGETGAGFAIVADEVRALAQRSAQAAKETAEKIEDSVRKSEQGVQISTKVGHHFTEILEKAREVDTLISEIAAASKEQNEGIGQVTAAVSQIDVVTQSNASTAEEAAAAAEELNAQAEALKDSVSGLQRLVGGMESVSSSGSAKTASAASDAQFRSPQVQAACVRSESVGGSEARAHVDQITKAIGAHGTWKSRLKRAIDTGASELVPEKVATDDQCEFGKWLYSLPEADRNTNEYRQAKALHACFHKEAGEVLRLALAGQKDTAMRCIAVDGTFGQASEKLTSQMIAWKASLTRGPAHDDARPSSTSGSAPNSRDCFEDVVPSRSR